MFFETEPLDWESSILTTKSLLHEMYDFQCLILKEINIFVSLIICSIPEKSIIVYKFKNSFSEKKLPLTVFPLISSKILKLLGAALIRGRR